MNVGKEEEIVEISGSPNPYDNDKFDTPTRPPSVNIIKPKVDTGPQAILIQKFLKGYKQRKQF